MLLAESISQALNGKKSGKGYRVRSVCHDGDGRNLLLCDAPDGGLIATCYSHGCSYKEIMLSLEEQGLKPKAEFTNKQRKTFKQIINKRQLREALSFESHILSQYLSDRNNDVAKMNNSNYLKLHPEFAPMPDEPFERELESSINVKKLIGELYGV